MIPTALGTPPETGHKTPVPAHVMHSNTFRRLTPGWSLLSLMILLRIDFGLTQPRLSEGSLFPDHGTLKRRAITLSNEQPDVSSWHSMYFPGPGEYPNAYPFGATSSTLRATTSQPRNLLSMATLNSAKSRIFRSVQGG